MKEAKFLEGREVPRRKGSSMKEGKSLEGRKFLAQRNESSTNQIGSSRTLHINKGYISHTSSVTLTDLNFTQELYRLFRNMCSSKMFLDSRLNVHVVPSETQFWYSCHISTNLFKHIIGATFHGAEVLLVFMKISYIVQNAMKDKPDALCKVVKISRYPFALRK